MRGPLIVKFITVLTTSIRLSVHESSPHLPTVFLLRSILILFSHLCLGLPTGILPSSLPTKTIHVFLPPIRATCPAHLIFPWFNHKSSQIYEAFRHAVFCTAVSPRPPQSVTPSSAPYSLTPSASVVALMRQTEFHTHTEWQVPL
jgi:hypothetical protein